MIERKVKKHLLRLAESYPVVTLTGPRQSGKTTLCKAAFSGYQYINLEDLDTRQLALNDPREFLSRIKKSAILDEIQKAPGLVSYIQGIVDDKKTKGQFILTGSEQFELTSSVAQSLAGRTAILKLLPFSFSELYGEKKVEPIDKVLFEGFYPRIHDQKLNPTEALSFYVSTYIERDVRNLRNITDLRQFEVFLKLCASNLGQELNKSRLGNDIGKDGKTINSWLSILQASYIVFLLPPHFKNFRKRIVKSPKIYFYDVGLAAFLLGIRNIEQLMSHPMRGYLFENFIVAELLKNRFNNVQENNLYFFRDNKGNEVDLVIDNGHKFDLVEIKSARTYTKDFFKGIDFYSKINKDVDNRYLIYTGDYEGFVSGNIIRSYNHLDGI